MRDSEVAKHIRLAASGDELARERLITHYKAYVINVVGQVCKRYISWSDEESSIGLIALNRAIDTYEMDAKKSFLNYVYLLVKRELIDYFRRESKTKHIPIEVESTDDESSINLYESEKSMDSYHQTVQKTELVEEILEFSQILHTFGIQLEELEHVSPTHQKTKAMLLEIADVFIQSPELVDFFLKKKRFPTTTFVKQFGYRRKTVERHRKYIIGLIIVKLHPEWRQLSAYIHVPSESEGKV
ncbi:RNA polymerase subunit sigma [Aquibacillus koreensis]|uniref:RNA polymerase sigma factor SigI n=1 Tax=Aquibacillus koreensis TaxID=279446 RepID=A0A9X4AJ13_9BACI|nr:sigma factor [Aquibacillus koreensis]MCT2536641.1 RNA polymerase subunit sigma [Aquibacillus koreensis]MDC3419980.1 RNA polymerase subunit sigma [Aquibacillus koreensis]